MVCTTYQLHHLPQWTHFFKVLHSISSNSVVTGTSLITDDLAFSLNIPARINYALNSPSLHVEGQADVDLDLMNGFLRLISSGHYTVDLTDGDVKAEIKVMVRLNGEFEITEASIDLSFGALALNATEALVNGEPIVWEEFNAQIKDLFDSIWPLIKPKLEEAVKGIGNEIFKVRIKLKQEVLVHCP